MEFDSSMPLMEHFKELRKRLLRIFIMVALSTGGGLFVSPIILNHLKTIPPASEISWNVFSPWDGLRMYMNIALLFAAAVTLPYIMYQIWQFVKSGLSRTEQKLALRYIPYTVLCFAIGLSFAYYVVFPMSYSFTVTISRKLELVETYGISQYLGFMMNIILPVSLAFELPVVVMFLTTIGILTPQRLRRMRRYAYLVLVIVSALISPPDFVSHFMVFIPLIVLYEISVWLSGVVFRQRAERQEAALGTAGSIEY
ncbi:twin-arginine translocase subunit TatC [Paenibacillus pasadenensis]|uniref:twin-arginine translocase subunit TatC n=1 Tax=Paenibacillus pasadenensis TaxID=217090 RepID=UPI00203B4445|nr:twin-arginine translocase subunit TatC [Paenibacillus pasadenensis]MCM3749673.1 twin-arginine translocase subunit TatC [Paenibacillus pasadenensis]